jgi:hypothetical protein
MQEDFIFNFQELKPEVRSLMTYTILSSDKLDITEMLRSKCELSICMRPTLPIV